MNIRTLSHTVQSSHQFNQPSLLPFLIGQAPNIAVISSDFVIAHLLRLELEKNESTVHLIYDHLTAFSQLKSHFQLVILDWQVMGISALKFCQYFRANYGNITLLVLTEQDQVSDRIAALESGADDCLSKPFDIEEVRAKIRAHLRRTERLTYTPIVFGDIQLDSLAREVRRDNQIIELTTKEFDLLEYLMRHPNQVLTRSQIIEQVWGNDFSGTSNIIEVYIRSLRRKLEQRGKSRLIQTVRGVGYVLRELQ